MQIQRQSIIQIQSELVQGFTKSQSRIHVWSHITQTLFNFSLQVAEIDQLYEATELLTMGKLPHFFVEHRTLAKALVKLDSFLHTNNPELRLLQTDLKYYYKQACFHSCRYTNFIVIVIQAPLTIAPLNRLMTVYHLYKIALASPTGKDHYTMIATNIKALIFHRDLDYYLSIFDEAYLPTTDTLDLRNSPLLLETRSKMSCGSALIEGDLQALKKYCRYYTVKGQIPKGIVKITNNKFLLTNISKITITCKQQNLTHKFRRDGNSVRAERTLRLRDAGGQLHR